MLDLAHLEYYRTLIGWIISRLKKWLKDRINKQSPRPIITVPEPL